MELNSNGPYGYLAVLNFIIFFVAFVFIGILLLRHEKLVRIKAETARARRRPPELRLTPRMPPCMAAARRTREEARGQAIAAA